MVTTCNPRIGWSNAVREIKRAVPVRQVLHLVGWRVCSRGRADCGLCEGSSKGSVAFNERLWRCHRCGEGGDVFTLIQCAHNCDFIIALKFLAAEARVELQGKQPNAQERARLRREQAERERQKRDLGLLCADLEERERSLRIECARQIRECDRVLTMPGPWSELEWLSARAAWVLRNEFLLPEFALLAFAAMEQRIGYLIASAKERAAMLAKIHRLGGVTTDGGHFVEIGV